MPIDFGPDRWASVKNNAQAWWDGKLDRPLIQMRVGGRDPGRADPPLPLRHFTAHYGREITPEAIVDRWDYNLSCTEYLGDAFPTVWPNFGPGVLAVFLGAEMETDERTVWFHPTVEKPVADCRLTLDLDDPVLARIRNVCRAAHDRWEGTVQVGMTDLGGNLDILSTFRPGEQLLLDLYDDPAAVKRVTWEAHEAWWAAFDDLNATLQPANPGYTAWASIFSESSYYMLQCDFCYMIGPDMFDEFVKPELAASCRRLVNPFYHLDGPGQLPHLDSLLSIPELKGIQWVPGAGAPPPGEWPDVYRRIREAGKLAQVLGGMEDFNAVVEQLGSAEGLVYIGGATADRRTEVLEFLERHGVA